MNDFLLCFLQFQRSGNDIISSNLYDCDVEDILVMIYLNLMTLFQEPGLDQEETQWPGRDHALGEDPGNINNYSNIRIICLRDS